MIQFSRKVIVVKINPVLGNTPDDMKSLIGKTGTARFSEERSSKLYPFLVKFDDSSIPDMIFMEDEIENI